MPRRLLLSLCCVWLGCAACAKDDAGDAGDGRASGKFKSFDARATGPADAFPGPGPVVPNGPEPDAAAPPSEVPAPVAHPTGCDAQRCRVRSLTPELAAFLAKEPDRLLAFEPGATAEDLATLRLATGLRRLELSHVDRPDLTRVPGAALVELRLGRTGLTDLAPLRAFSRLTHLVLFEAPFTDASPLEGLTALEVLDLSRCPNVRDFNFLPKLTRLTSLLLSGTAFSDAALLGGLTGLRELGLGHTQLAASGLDALSPLTGLSGLHLDGLAGLTDLSALAGLTGLRHLGLSDTGVRDLKPLAGLVELRTLKLTRAPVTDLSPDRKSVV